MSANDDLLADLLMRLTRTESNLNSSDDNTLIEKMLAPNERVTPDDTLQTSISIANKMKWGGTGFIAGWLWSQGQYLGYGVNMISQGMCDVATSTDNLVLTTPISTSFKWSGTGKTANWLWNQGIWK